MNKEEFRLVQEVTRTHETYRGPDGLSVTYEITSERPDRKVERIYVHKSTSRHPSPESSASAVYGVEVRDGDSKKKISTGKLENLTLKDLKMLKTLPLDKQRILGIRE